MKRIIVSWIILGLLSGRVHAQDPGTLGEQLLEHLTETADAETEDDHGSQQLDQYRRRPLNLNTATREQLLSFPLLTPDMTDQLIRHRNLFGSLISIYELQAIPGWETGQIRRVLPYVSITENPGLLAGARARFNKGERVFLFRTSRQLEQAAGFRSKDTLPPGFEGDPWRLFVRYRQSFKDLLSFGITADKDAGEAFFRGSNKQGFDFYSIHLFLRRLGRIKALAIGDFSVNMGQGLIQWQSLAFSKSADAMIIRRQAPVLKPYNSAGESNFQRGIGCTIGLGSIEATVFASRQGVDANLEELNPDRLRSVISSFQTSGYHRTVSEISDEANTRVQSMGMSVTYRLPALQVGLNLIHHQFSRTLIKRDEPYNLYAIRGTNWSNASIDWAAAWRNLHWFGELATDKLKHAAVITGLQFTLDRSSSLSFVYRNFGARYRSLHGQAFGESYRPENERGFYAGLSFRPWINWKLDAFVDVYAFPWLRYQVNEPSSGTDLLLNLVWTPSKTLELYSRLRLRERSAMGSSWSWRYQLNWVVTPALALKTRVEINGVQNRMMTDEEPDQVPGSLQTDHTGRQSGFAISQDLKWKPASLLWKIPATFSFRLSYFDTGGYASRIYGYEQDVLFSNSVPAFYLNGLRYYVLTSVGIKNNIDLWLRWAQTLYPSGFASGSGVSAVSARSRSEVKIQVRIFFQY